LRDHATLRIGLLGVGLAEYWPQFDGLYERLLGYLATVEGRLGGHGREVVSFGLVDNPEQALQTGHEARAKDMDILVIHVTTYALSSLLLPIVRRAKVPVLLLDLQPAAAIDYTAFNALADRTVMTGNWLAYCCACPIPEFANVFARCGVPLHQIHGVLEDDPACWREVEEWLEAARTVHVLSHTTLGLMGHYYSGMLDIATDLTAVCHIFGVHLEHLEVDELSRMRQAAGEAEVAAQLSAICKTLDVHEDCATEELERAARTSAGLHQFAQKYRLGALAYYYKGTGVAANEDTMSSIILGTSLLTASGVPVAGEYEIKNVLAMKILDTLGAGGSFTEYYAVDYDDDAVLMGHDGPGHPGIAQSKVRVRPLEVYHGKVGKGLSVEMSVKSGPVTLLSVVESKQHGFHLLVAEGEAVPGPHLEIGNTNSRYRFSLGARGFMHAWNSHSPAHHCAVGVGHVASVLEKIGALLGIAVVRVC
jgi:L-arabinose isomerase